MRSFLLLILSILLLVSCSVKEKADLILYNASIHTMWDSLPEATHMAVKDGRILAVGNEREVMGKYDAAELLNGQGRPVYPGFFDAHCHFWGYAEQLGRVDLTGTGSFQEVIDRIVEFSSTQEGWILGRGWDNTEWENKELPVKKTLDSLFPSRPVFVKRVDGHAALANQAALDAAGITRSTRVDGGIIGLDESGELTGILIDNAVDLLNESVPATPSGLMSRLLEKASDDCIEVGLTSLTDAGLDLWQVQKLDSLQKEGFIKQRLHVMINPKEENFRWVRETGGTDTEWLRVKSVKVYADGALGSRGALLKKPYSDQHGHYGLLLTPADTLEKIYDFCAEHGFQAATHCIGDSSVKMVLRMYAERLKGVNDKRWRIEHAQVVEPADRHFFADYTIIPSVQPVHAMSDRNWAADRLGEERMAGAYAYASLLGQMGMIAMGSDFPVEQINPLHGYLAAVARKDVTGSPREGWRSEEKISREDGLKGLTIWSAMANFAENFSGSLEPGKVADFVILEQDILTASENEIAATGVVTVYVNGKIVSKK